MMFIDDFYDNSSDFEDYHDYESAYDGTYKARKHRNSRDYSGSLQSLLAIALFICALAFLSFIYKGCSGAIAQLYPDDDEYAVTDDYDYYHRKQCGCVDEDNFAEWMDLETAKEEGLEPCPYCKPKTGEDE